MRHSRITDIDNALIYTRLWRPVDSVTTLPYKRDENGQVSRLQDDEIAKALERAGNLAETCADIHIELRHDGYRRCWLFLKLLHEGVTGQKGYGIKYEHLSIHQGPAAACFYHRIARLDIDSQNEESLGGKRHANIVFIKNPGPLGGKRKEGVPSIEEIHPESENDAGPAREFFAAVTARAKRLSRGFVSEIGDHRSGVRLMAAAYLSGIRGQPVNVNFKPGELAPLP